MICQGQELLAQPMQLDTYRAPTDNDRLVRLEWYGYGAPRTWKEIPEHYNLIQNKTYHITCTTSAAGDVILKQEGVLAPVARRPLTRYTAVYTIRPSCEIHTAFSGNLRDGALFLPRLGYMLVLRPGIEEMTYYGRDPRENYIDMKHHAPIGCYHSSVSEEYVPYPKPQEHGNHTDVKWAALTNMCG